jgi:hypothetical protein
MDKFKEGISVKDLETLARRYMTEGFVVLAIIIAILSSVFNFFVSSGWGIIFGGLCAAASMSFPKQIMKIAIPAFNFLKKQDTVIQIIIGVVRIIFAVFLPFLVFAVLGVLAGLAFHFIPTQTLGKEEEAEKKEEKPPENEDEHL